MPPAAAAEDALRILVVDDSRAQRAILSAQLRTAGHRILVAGSGEEGLEISRSEPVDLVLSDWMMPGMSGLDFCRAFRSLDRADYGYFILLTARGDRDDIALGLEVGADDFLVKPVNAVELHARIAAGRRIIEMQRQLSQKNRLISATLEELRSLYANIDHDLVEARKLQQSLVHERLRDFGNARAALLLRSSGHVGGDLVGCFASGAGEVGLYSIDVSGHGITSALMAARLAGWFSAGAPDQNIALERGAEGGYRMLPPAEVLGKLNRLMLEEMRSDQYCTVALAMADLATGRVRLTQAGHPHPALQRRDGTVSFLGEGGLPVGLLAEAAFGEAEITLAPGDRLLLYSDGFTECPGTAGQLLDEGGLAALLAANRGLRGPALLEALVWDLSRFRGVEDFPDDVSGIVLEYDGPPDAGR